ncbi:MAG: LysM peptidoglycan-binding domain-containing protein [Patulibacter minatonensis]
MSEGVPESFVEATLDVERGTKIACWFNPATLQRSRSANWQAREGLDGGLYRDYAGAGGERISLELLLHGRDGMPGREASDLPAQMQALIGLVEPTIQVGNAKRPPTVTLEWGAYTSFRGAVTAVDVTQELFGASGAPLRALVRLSLEQAVPEAGQTTAKGQNPTTRANMLRQVHVVRTGDTLPLIAYQYLGDAERWIEIAELNRVEDPTRLAAGASLLILQGQA